AHRSLITFGASANGHGARSLLFLAQDKHVRDLVKLRLADLEADLFGTIVALNAKALDFQLPFHLLPIAGEFLAHGDNAHLLRRQPGGKRAGEVLDQDGYEAFHRSKRSPMDHHRSMRLIVWADVFELEALGQIVIKLHGAKLPFAAD